MPARRRALKQAPTLKSSLDDIDAVRQEALEEGTIDPAASSCALTKILVARLHAIPPGRYDAFPEDRRHHAQGTEFRNGFEVTVKSVPNGSVVRLPVSPDEWGRSCIWMAMVSPTAFREVFSSSGHLGIHGEIGPAEPIAPRPLEAYTMLARNGGKAHLSPLELVERCMEPTVRPNISKRRLFDGDRWLGGGPDVSYRCTARAFKTPSRQAEICRPSDRRHRKTGPNRGLAER